MLRRLVKLWRRVPMCVFLFLVSAAVSSIAQPAKPRIPVDYVQDIKTIFAKHCTSCHGPKKQQNGLRLDTAAAAIAGGDSGPAIVPGKPNESLIINAIDGGSDLERMPLEGPPLSREQAELVRAWVIQGAKFPTDEVAITVKSDHWAFNGPERGRLPKVENAHWPLNPIDYFVLAQLDHAGVQPSPSANKATLIRRISLDLIGIPPPLEEVDAFLPDTHPDAYERLVDRLLASPHYGERWGRHWLDVARYADSNGYTRDFGRQIWKYRDWVIDAINRDLPFDRFTIEQLAGDMLTNVLLDQIIATGFHRNTLINEEGGTDQEQFRVDAVADRVATTGVAFLGLTLGCARCHDHKYDPISQREYYQIFAFFNNCDEPMIDAPSERQVARGDVRQRDDVRSRIARLEKHLDGMSAELTKQQLVWEETVTPELRRTLPGPLQAALDQSLEERDDAQKKLVKGYFQTTEAARRKFPLVAEITTLRASEPEIPTTMVLRERAERRATHIHRRGNFLDKGRRVDPAVPAVLPSLPKDVDHPNRLDFARWLVTAENPLTPRVIMNRHWQHFFGRGIVETENDFGLQGSLPTHPLLLDWLAVEFVRRQWSVKAMHRLIVTSATYRQSSRAGHEHLRRDPYNRLLARQSRLRLDAEIVRDSALSVSGLRTRKIGGPSVHPPQPDGVFEFTQDPKPWNAETGADRYRRGMYTFLWRSSPYPSLVTFDFPSANTTCTRRTRSNTPLQSLVLANDEAFVETARAMATRVLAGQRSGKSERAEFAFRLGLARPPSKAERERLLELINTFENTYKNDLQAARQLANQGLSAEHATDLAIWTSVCRVVLNLDEFITRE